ncbi:Pantoate-beta-alanine ligase [Allorhodopirellula solitaria]|uniref:Pantothenate synthetase n=2 Tax=Allorhodopirellula solitaria TaxID=2527987 RepID=A0A5C5YJ83_9BACT|nr:Pantoate-beta-alanine ligase [Allorhodopirellula solitaria]
MRTWCRERQRDSQTVGFVPTMGALHEGHLSLVRQAKAQCDVCVVSVFVNPTQFAANEDLSRYPRPLERDLQLIANEGADAVFLPNNGIMYPPGFGSFILPPPVALPLEGQSRPEHFRGVTTVVMKLLQIIPADAAFFGQKDFQQLRVIEDMVRDLNIPTEIVSCQIVRDDDGLALSSRNRYLSDEQRQAALSLFRALGRAEAMVAAGERDTQSIEKAMTETLAVCDSIDYAVVAEVDSLQPMRTLQRPAVALVAARVGNTRLIDNRIL